MTSEQARANPDRVEGSCLCGAIRFETGLPSLVCGHCHCSICRRAHGAAFVTWFTVPRSAFTLRSGKDALGRHRSSAHGVRSFCSRCGSSLFFETSERPEQIDIVLANVHGPIDKPPLAHAFYDCRVDWLDVRDELPRLGGHDGLQPL